MAEKNIIQQGFRNTKSVAHECVEVSVFVLVALKLLSLK